MKGAKGEDWVKTAIKKKNARVNTMGMSHHILFFLRKTTRADKVAILVLNELYSSVILIN